MDAVRSLRGLKNKAAQSERVCRFFQWFWYSTDNRDTRWPVRVVEVLSFSRMRVERGGSRMTVSLWDDGCYGYELHRQLWRLLGHGLMNRRWKWFQHWNRRKCFKCGNDTFERDYRDIMEGTLMEEGTVCKKCRAPAWYYAYGDHEDYWTCEWENWELKLFGNAVRHNYHEDRKCTELNRVNAEQSR